MFESKNDTRKSPSKLIHTHDADIPNTKSVPRNPGKSANSLKVEVQLAER